MLSNHPNCLGGNGPSASSDLIGDVDGPASATDNAVARFDGTTGKLIQNSVVTISDTTGDIAGATSLTSPAATNLTLAGGSTGASLVLEQGSSGVPVFTTTNEYSLGTLTTTSTQTGVGNIPVFQFRNSNSTVNNGVALRFSSVDTGSTYRSGTEMGTIFTARTASTISAALYFATSNAGPLTERMRIAANGDVNIVSTTAGASNAGALVVAGGLSAAGASYFGGAVTATGNAATTAAITTNNPSGSSGTKQHYVDFTAGATVIARAFRGNGTAGYIDNGLNIDNFGGFQIGLNVLGGSGDSFKIRNAGTTDLLTITSAGAATFAGAVTAAVVTSTGAGYTNSGFQITNTSASRTTGFFLTNAGVTSIRDVTGAADLFTLALTGAATFAGTVIAPAATASLAPLRIPHGTAPTSPTDGDMWTTTAGLFIRINGATVGPLS